MSTLELIQTCGTLSPEEKSFPVLPPELEREIFLLAAQANRGMSARLMHVAFRVKEWIEPFAYKTVVLRTLAHATKFLDALTSYHSPAFAKKHVKALCIRPSIPLALTVQLLRVCSGLESLALWILPQTETADLIDLISSLPLTSLSLNLRSILPPNQPKSALRDHPAFMKVTHLDFVNHWVLWTSPPGIETLPHLTHVAFRFWSRGSVSSALSTILEQSPKLQVIVLLADSVVIPGSKEFLEKEGISDIRVVVLKHTRDADEWELMERDAESMWERADTIVAWRRHNKAKPFDFPPEFPLGS